MMVGAATRDPQPASSWPPPLAAIPSPVSVTWPRTGYGNKAFTGREWDPETGLYYYRARYYDPKIGRFISEDPIGFAAGTNFYNYVENNPVRYTDPYGLSPAPSPPGPPPPGGNPFCWNSYKECNWIIVVPVAVGTGVCVAACPATGPMAPVCIAGCIALGGAGVAGGEQLICVEKYKQCIKDNPPSPPSTACSGGGPNGS